MKKKVTTMDNKKLIKVALLGGVFASLLYFQAIIIDSLYYLFAMMLVLGWLLYLQGDMNYAFIVWGLQILSWLILVFVIKITAFNMVFPKIRIVDELKNAITYARKIKSTKGEDQRFYYMKIKFKFFPVFRLHTLKLPKPEYQGKHKVPNGVEGIRWKRMPSSLDIITKELNIKWNSIENAYELTPDNLPRIEENIDEYRSTSKGTINRLSQNVNESVRGDAGLLKDQYQTGIPISMELVTPDMEKVKKLPPMRPQLREVIDIESAVDSVLEDLDG
jgi:hypothetical protein